MVPSRSASRLLPDSTSPWRGPGGGSSSDSALGTVMVYGMVGYMVMGWSFMDAFYQVFITISAVGLTEVHPLIPRPRSACTRC